MGFGLGCLFFGEYCCWCIMFFIVVLGKEVVFKIVEERIVDNINSKVGREKLRIK